jgi:hypothetical protein
MRHRLHTRVRVCVRVSAAPRASWVTALGGSASSVSIAATKPQGSAPRRDAMRVAALGGKANAAAGRGVMQRAADTRGLVLRHPRSAGGAQGEEAGSARKLE